MSQYKIFVIGLLSGAGAGFIIGWLVGHWAGWCGAFDLFKDSKVRPKVENQGEK